MTDKSFQSCFKRNVEKAILIGELPNLTYRTVTQFETVIPE
jgi:hypothetical protein